MIEINQHITLNKDLFLNIKIDDIAIQENGLHLLSQYKISNFWKGKFFIKRLINKIFKYHIKMQMVWKNDFWKKIVIKKGTANIDSCETLSKSIEQKIPINRYKDIKYYEKLISNDNYLDPLLFISAKAVAYLGGRAKNKDFFILDGTRRLIAHALSNKRPDILIIDLEDEK